MLQSDLKVALRQFRKHPLHTAITGFGLAVALACSLLLGLYVHHELSYDDFHANAERIVRITSTDSAAGRTRAKVSALLGPRLEERRPEVQETVRLDRADQVTVRRTNETWGEDQFFYADPSFFDVFSFQVRRGDPATALDAPDAVVLTASAADRYFGDQNPIGKPLPVTGVDTFTVTAVMDDVPSTSHVQPNVIASFRAKGDIERFFEASAWTYALLAPGTSIEAFDAAMADFVDEKGWTQPGLSAFHAQPLTSIHLHSHHFQEIQPTGSVQTVWILGAAALLILLVACSNFVTMSTARAVDRAASVGVRKALGAGRGQLVRQFVTETLLVVGAAAGLGGLGAALLLPGANQLLGTSLSLGGLLEPEVAGAAALVLGVVSVVAAGYPAFVLSSYQPSAVLRKQGTTSSGFSRLQQGLVAVQFAVSVLLLVGTVAVNEQVSYLLEADMGFDAQQLVSIPMEGPLRQQQGAFAEELRSKAGIMAVSRSSGSPLNPRINDGYEVEGRTVELHNLLVDRNYVETTGLTVTAGRDFDSDRPSDIFQKVLVNRQAADALGWEDPVGNTFRRTGRGWPGDKRYEVIGVVEGLHTQSLHDPVKPVVLQVAPPYFSQFVVRAEDGRLSEALASMRTTWEEFVPDRAFQRTILSTEVASLYQQEQRLARLTTAFGAVALFIACLGLYGLAAFTARRRRREAGIRKALGASAWQVTRRFTTDLVGLVGLGLLGAVPLGWIGAHRWLQQFAYATEVPVAGLVGLSLGTVLVAGLVVGVHTLQAAGADPAHVLRDE